MEGMQSIKNIMTVRVYYGIGSIMFSKEMKYVKNKTGKYPQRAIIPSTIPLPHPRPHCIELSLPVS